MPVALVTTSHTPLLHYTEPAEGVRDRVDGAFDDARRFIADFAPDLIVLFAPDHYNGFFYDMMPAFCVGAAAQSIGDYGSTVGPLRVDRSAAYLLARAVMAADVDTAVSENMFVDHGFVQPLQELVGGIDKIDTVPIFINCVAEPLGAPRRAIGLGAAIGSALAAMDRRVLLLGSGGLSHDPPVPQLEGAPPEVAAMLISEGRHLNPEQRAARQERVIRAGREYAAGTSTMQPLNPQWDQLVLATLATGDFEQITSWTTEWFTEQAGHAAHEVRTLIAAYAALAASGPYEVTSSFYEAIPDWIAGFAVTTARPVTVAAPV